MKETKIDFLYLNEEDMIKAGVKEMAGCVEAMEEMFKPIVGSAYSLPPYYSNLFSFIFLGWIVIGVIWYSVKNNEKIDLDEGIAIKIEN